MKKTMLLIAALALGSAPAAAQNESAENVAASDNMMNATVPGPDNTVAAGNAMTGAPMDMNMAAPVEEPAPAPAPPPPRSTRFPYGLIGLVGLVGLLGRRRRD